MVKENGPHAHLAISSAPRRHGLLGRGAGLCGSRPYKAC